MVAFVFISSIAAISYEALMSAVVPFKIIQAFSIEREINAIIFLKSHKFCACGLSISGAIDIVGYC